MVLVTGGASFIGSHLVDSLLKMDADVVVADDFSSGKLENLEYPLIKKGLDKWEHEHLTVFKGDLKDREFTKLMVKDADIVFHLAIYTRFPKLRRRCCRNRATWDLQ